MADPSSLRCAKARGTMANIPASTPKPPLLRPHTPKQSKHQALLLDASGGCCIENNFRVLARRNSRVSEHFRTAIFISREDPTHLRSNNPLREMGSPPQGLSSPGLPPHSTRLSASEWSPPLLRRNRSWIARLVNTECSPEGSNTPLSSIHGVLGYSCALWNREDSAGYTTPECQTFRRKCPSLPDLCPEPSPHP